MPANAWVLAKESVTSFIEDEALSRGAAIAFYTVISIAPVLFIVVAIAGLVFGQDAARGAIAEQVSGLMGRESADLLQNAIRSAANRSSGVVATVVGLVTLVVAASGVFGEMQAALNAFWKVEPRGTTVSRLIRARAVSLGLVAALGFLLLVSLVINAGLAALGKYIDAYFALRRFRPAGADFPGILHPDLGPVRRDLQGIARQASGVARCPRGRHRHGPAVHPGEIPDRSLYRQERHCLQLWRGRCPHPDAVVGLLFGADFPAGGGVYKGLCQPPGEPSAGPGDFPLRPRAAFLSRRSLPDRAAQTKPRS